jgi:hypothetical protein
MGHKNWKINENRKAIMIDMMAYHVYSSNMWCHINISKICVDLESLKVKYEWYWF